MHQIAENQYCHFFDDAEFVPTDRVGFRHRIINGDDPQPCFWRIKGGAEDRSSTTTTTTSSSASSCAAHSTSGSATPTTSAAPVRAGDVYLAASRSVDHGDSIFVGDDEFDEC
ncbi:MAG: hypothetical protein R2697_08325 [Ilumatobacteraceae bacterium]